MAGKTNINELARRYVTAVLDLAGSGVKLKKLTADLNEVETLLESNADFNRMATSPLISKEDQIECIKAIGNKAKFDKITINFLKVIAVNGRLESLGKFIEVFKAKVAELGGEVTAEVTSAKNLTAAQLSGIAKDLSKEFGKKVKIEHKLDESVIGGLVVKIGSKMYDYSVKSRLERLRNDLKKAS